MPDGAPFVVSGAGASSAAGSSADARVAGYYLGSASSAPGSNRSRLEAELVAAMAHCEAVETIFPLLCSPAELAVLGASLLAEPRRAIDEGAGASFAALENAWCSTDAALPACAPGWVAPPGALGELAANAAAAASAELMAHAARGASADEAAHTATVLAREVMDKAGASRRKLRHHSSSDRKRGLGFV